MRMAQMQQFSPEMVQKISMVLHKRLRSLGEQSRRGFGGVKAVADLLNRMDPEATGKVILEAIEQDNASLATSIRNLMFTFQDFLEVPETGFANCWADGQENSGHGAEGRFRRTEKSFLQVHVFARRGNVEGRHGRARAGAWPATCRARRQEIVALARKLEARGKMVLKNEAGGSVCRLSPR